MDWRHHKVNVTCTPTGSSCSRVYNGTRPLHDAYTINLMVQTSACWHSLRLSKLFDYAFLRQWSVAVSVGISCVDICTKWDIDVQTDVIIRTIVNTLQLKWNGIPDIFSYSITGKTTDYICTKVSLIVTIVHVFVIWAKMAS